MLERLRFFGGAGCRQKQTLLINMGIINHIDKGVFLCMKKSRESQKQIKFLCIEDLMIFTTTMLTIIEI
jgi:hypothetical protein